MFEAMFLFSPLIKTPISSFDGAECCFLSFIYSLIIEACNLLAPFLSLDACFVSASTNLSAKR